MEKKKKFAEGFCFFKYFWIFIFGSVFGSYYEQISYYFQTWISSGVGVWELRQGVIYGPFNIIYGIGAVVLTALLCQKEQPSWKIFLYGALAGGVTEFIAGWGYSFVFHNKAWDYSSHFFNFNGWTSLPIMIEWGICALLFVKIIFPFLSKLIEMSPLKLMTVITVIFTVFMSLNMFVSWTALLRQSFRRQGYEPLTPIDEFYDKYYTDEFLKQYFPNTEKDE